MYRALTTAAIVPLALGDYAYSYDYTNTPTATFAPTRAETYAPTRMTVAPSYAPTTDSYAPTFGSCPPIGAPDACPVDATGLPPCNVYVPRFLSTPSTTRRRRAGGGGVIMC